MVLGNDIKRWNTPALDEREEKSTRTNANFPQTLCSSRLWIVCGFCNFWTYTSMTFCLLRYYLSHWQKSSIFEFDLSKKNLCSRRSVFLDGIPLTFFSHAPFQASLMATFYYIIGRHLYSLSFMKWSKSKNNSRKKKTIIFDLFCFCFGFFWLARSVYGDLLPFLFIGRFQNTNPSECIRYNQRYENTMYLPMNSVLNYLSNQRHMICRRWVITCK